MRWGGNAILAGGALAIVSYVMCWPFFILHAVWLTLSGQHQKRQELMAALMTNGALRLIYGIGGVLMSIPIFVLLAICATIIGQIDPAFGASMMRWWDKNCGDVLLCLFVYPFVIMLVVVVAATIINGIIQSIKARVPSEKPQVSGKTLAIVVYLLGIPITVLAFILYYMSGDPQPGDEVYFLACEKIMLMFTAFLVFRKLLPKLMVHSTPSVHKHASWIAALLTYPVYYALLIKTGIFDLWIVFGDFLRNM